MKKLKSLIFLFLISTLFICCKNDTFSKEEKDKNIFYDKTFKWEIKIPKAYVRVEDKEIKDIKNEARNLLNPNNLAQFANTIVGFKNNDLNIFIANYEEYLGSVDMYDLKIRLKDAVIIDKIYKFIPNAKTDYSITKENISGLEFRKSRISIIENGKVTLTYVIYSRLFKDKTFFAVIMYDKEAKGEAMINIFRQSKFK